MRKIKDVRVNQNLKAHSTIGVNVLTKLARGVGWLMIPEVCFASFGSTLKGNVSKVIGKQKCQVRLTGVICVHREGILPPISIWHVCRLAINTNRGCNKHD